MGTVAIVKAEHAEDIAKYDAMCEAIAEASYIDELQPIRDKAAAMQEYARRLKNKQAEKRCAGIRLRAEKRMGILLMEMKERGERRTSQTANPSGTLVVAGNQGPPTLEQLGITKDESSKFQQLAGIPDEQFEKILFESQEAPTTKGVINSAYSPHVAHNSGDNEWYTPAKYIEAARKVMGEIDIDPATSLYAQETVKAREFYTKETDGLNRSWMGRVWLNPPYSSQLIMPFINKLVAELEEGRATEAILLVNNATDTAWFHKAEEIAALICFTRGRIQFVTNDGKSSSPLQGQAFFYFGEHLLEFRSQFSDFGFVR